MNSYQEVYQTIGIHAPYLLPAFADKWERFPNEAHGKEIVKALKKQESYYKKCKYDEMAEPITGAIKAIESRY